MRARETAQRLGALAFLANDKSSVFNTYMAAYDQFQGIQHIQLGKKYSSYTENKTNLTLI